VSEVKYTIPDVGPVALALGFLSASEPRLVVLTRDSATSKGSLAFFSLDLSYVTGTNLDFDNPFDLAIAGSNVWFTESGAGKIWLAAMDNQGGLPQEQVTGESGCESIAVDTVGVYWTRPGDGLVKMLDHADNTTKPIASSEGMPFGVAADDSGVYWLTNDGKLRRWRPSAQDALPPSTVSSGFKASFADRRGRRIALTSQYVVWITSDGKVLRHAK